MNSLIHSFSRYGKWSRRSAVSVTALLYLGSLFLPAIGSGASATSGWTLLKDGWMGVILVMSPAWLANPAYLAALVGFRQGAYSFSYKTSLVAAGLALCSFFPNNFFDDAVAVTPFADLSIGFYVWLVSMLLLSLESFCLRACDLSRNTVPILPSVDTATPCDG
jgi:hypothetical protein